MVLSTHDKAVGKTSQRCACVLLLTFVT